jgi:hypothetical protein
MSPRRMFRNRAGWTSAAAVLVVAGVLAGTMLANAAGPPLPKRTPAQLLVAMREARPPGPMTAVITENANLGFPSLPNIPGLQSSVLSGASFITGTHTFDIWYGGPRHLRIAVPVSFGETDLRVNGNQVWLWNSHGQMATHLILPARQAIRAVPSPVQVKRIGVIRLKLSKLHYRALPRLLPRLRLPLVRNCLVAARARVSAHPAKQAVVRPAIVKCLRGLRVGRQVPVALRPPTPQQAANKFLAAIGPSTKVTVAGSTVVAGRSAYQLVIAPRTSQSLISRIVIAVDAKTYLPLQLQVFARGTSGAAFQIGFTSLTFGQPAASNFTFTPPAGAHVRTEPLSAGLPGLLGPLSLGGMRVAAAGPLIGQRFLPASSRARLPAALHLKGMIHVVKGRVVITRNFAIRRLKQMHVVLRAIAKHAVRVVANGSAAYPPVAGQIVMPASGPVPASAFSTVSVDPGWPFGLGQAGPGLKVLGTGWLSVAVISSGNSPQGAQAGALLRVLMNAAAPVHGAWGSGRLLRTSLFSVLFTNNGKVLIGAVSPGVLYADAAKVK